MYDINLSQGRLLAFMPIGVIGNCYSGDNVDLCENYMLLAILSHYKQYRLLVSVLNTSIFVENNAKPCATFY